MSKSRRRENSESCTSAILFSSMNYLHVGNSSAEIVKYICLNWRWRICWFFFRCDKLFRCLANFFWTFCLFNTCLTVINTEYWVVKLFFSLCNFSLPFFKFENISPVLFFLFFLSVLPMLETFSQFWWYFHLMCFQSRTHFSPVWFLQLVISF